MEKLISLSKIFSDKNRVKILVLILREKSLCVCEICDTLELSQPLVSRHLKQMKEAGIVEAKKSKKWVNYSVIESPEPLLICFISEVRKTKISLKSLIVCNNK